MRGVEGRGYTGIKAHLKELANKAFHANCYVYCLNVVSYGHRENHQVDNFFTVVQQFSQNVRRKDCMKEIQQWNYTNYVTRWACRQKASQTILDWLRAIICLRAQVSNSRPAKEIHVR